MPRLTDKQYLKYRKFLRRLWLYRLSTHSFLTPTQQWQIHAYFRPSEDLTNEELLEHRKTITVEHPSLPHQAGRAIKDFGQILRGNAKARATVTSFAGRNKTARHVGVRSIVRPQIDIPRLARVLLDLETSKNQGSNKH
jgi:hypothetical protein